MNATSASGCQWTVSTSDAWLHLVGPATGTVAGDVTIAVDATTMFGRRGTVTVNWPGGSHSITVNQGCVVMSTENLTAEKQVHTVSVGSLCSFAVNNGGLSFDVPWIELYMTQLNGSVLDFLIDRNTGPVRTGHATVGFGQITFIQAAGATANCVTSIAPTSQAFDENGGTGTFAVTAAPGCYWEAVAHSNHLDTELTIVAGSSGTGNGQVTFNQGANGLTFSKSASILVGGTLQFQVTQSACPVAVSPLNFRVPAAGGTFSTTVTVTGRVPCGWADFSNDAFITRPREDRAGSGTVEFSVAQNPTGRARSGTLSVADQTVVVTQDP